MKEKEKSSLTPAVMGMLGPLIWQYGIPVTNAVVRTQLPVIMIQQPRLITGPVNMKMTPVILVWIVRS